MSRCAAEEKSVRVNATAAGKTGWPLVPQRQRPQWFPTRQRLIGLVRSSRDSFVLPPAIVRKAAWRD